MIYRAAATVLILYNIILAATHPGQNLVLFIASTQLRLFVHNQLGRAVLQLPGQDMKFVQDIILGSTIRSGTTEVHSSRISKVICVVKKLFQVLKMPEMLHIIYITHISQMPHAQALSIVTGNLGDIIIKFG